MMSNLSAPSWAPAQGTVSASVTYTVSSLRNNHQDAEECLRKLVVLHDPCPAAQETNDAPAEVFCMGPLQLMLLMHC
jgi:hypothetical protein